MDFSLLIERLNQLNHQLNLRLLVIPSIAEIHHDYADHKQLIDNDVLEAIGSDSPKFLGLPPNHEAK